MPKTRKQKIQEMRESMDKLGEEYDVPDPSEKMDSERKANAEKRRKEKIRAKRAEERKKKPFSAIGLGKKIKKRGKQLRESVK